MTTSNTLQILLSQFANRMFKANKTILILFLLNFLFVSCKKDQKINLENEGRLIIENTNWAAYHGISWSQSTGTIELSPNQFILIRARIASSILSLQFKDTNWNDFLLEFVQYIESSDEYQFKIQDAPYSYAELYVNEKELRIYVKESSNSSRNFQIFFKKD